MKIAVLSDLHLEGAKYELDFAPADVLILAGDITSSHEQSRDPYNKFIKRAYDFYGEENVFEIEGNHTGYGGIIDYFGSPQFCDVRDDVVLIGATLWSGEGSQFAYRCIADKNIPGFTWEWMNSRHELDLAFIEEKLKLHSGKKCVVFTHHLPSVQCIHEKWLKDGILGLNLAFYTDLDWMIEKYYPEMWICGHTHDGFHKFHSNGKTQLVCNPRGYSNYDGTFENSDFNSSMVVEVG